MALLLFGTDGIRGLAGTYPLDAKTAHAGGAALGKLVAKSGQEQQVVIGMDTRGSGSWLPAEVPGGLARPRGSPEFSAPPPPPSPPSLPPTHPPPPAPPISAPPPP